MKVSIFVTCLVEHLYPKVGMATVRILERLGLEVDFKPDQTCCGQPAYNSGYPEEAARVGRNLLAVFSGSDYIVTPSGSCAAMIKVFLPKLLVSSPEEAEASKRMAERTYELTDFLSTVLGTNSTGASFPHIVTYHDSCHLLRELGIREQPRRLIGGVADIDFREMEDPELCCGFGGLFSVKFDELSAVMGSQKLRAIEETGAEYVVATDVSCLMHLDGLIRREKTPLETLHVAELLAEF